MEVSQIIELMKVVNENGLTDFTYEENGVSLKIRKHSEKTVIQQPVMTQAIQPLESQFSVAEPVQERGIVGNIVKSPLVGTFYSASAPDAEPYVKVGDVVKKGQVLGIVEAMKLMNEIESEFDGVVKEIKINNGDLIEFDQPLFVIG